MVSIQALKTSVVTVVYPTVPQELTQVPNIERYTQKRGSEQNVLTWIQGHRKLETNNGEHPVPKNLRE